jgi:hypothetical protein
MNFRVSRDNSKWSKIGGLYTRKKDSIKRFENLGGFIDGVIISKKSKYHFGKEKNWLLKTYLYDN